MYFYPSRSQDEGSFLELLRSRYQPTYQDQPTLEWSFAHPQCQVQAFQLDKLEEDLVRTFVTGKPLILTPSQLRKVVEFRDQKKRADVALE